MLFSFFFSEFEDGIQFAVRLNVLRCLVLTETGVDLIIINNQCSASGMR